MCEQTKIKQNECICVSTVMWTNDVCTLDINKLTVQKPIHTIST